MPGSYNVAPGVCNDLLALIVSFHDVKDLLNVREIALDRNIVLLRLEYAIVLTFNQDLTYSDETRITMGRPESTNDDFSVNSAKAYLGDGLE